ncbi:hypothetical protein NLJ89_g3806 [Agrocybe chaxingu]|uniref:glucan endo-1,3-beta-D-glucosidase n=1 Tax=Agrocybe chaxingu TaxID=84603 RepID=A0A9W8K4J3_9AGAR|nr:hypothetical protein NLJ89_g3806 [Agrocybe chaxingu]
MSDTHYQSLGMSSALEKQQKQSRRSKWIVVGSVIALVVLIAVGVTVGVVVSNNNKEKSGSSSGSSGSSNGSSGSSSGSSGGSSSNDPTGTIKDIQILSQLTSRIRLYGADCNQTALVLEAIKQTKVDMQVFIGNYVVDGDPGAYERQREVIKEAIETYGTEHIAGVTVGNEFMLNYVTGRNSNDANSAIGNEGAAILKANIEDTKKMIADMNLDKTIPVGNSDAGSYFNTQIMETMDYGLSNVHAWFANTTAEGASKWVTDFFDETNVKPAALLPNNPKMYIAETGWPTDSKDISNKNNGAADASVPNLQVFLDTFVCQANSAGIGYFYFEDIKYGGVEGHWGLFTKDRKLKDVTIPDCAAP